MYLDRSWDVAKACESDYASEAAKAGFSEDEKMSAFNPHMGLNGWALLSSTAPG